MLFFLRLQTRKKPKIDYIMQLLIVKLNLVVRSFIYRTLMILI
ncbi:hypothetical protein FM106_11620 [Brachybacterium faecium]|nr:hypothetical protein FM106_11620 [Brachybacterium faecium]